MKVYAWTDRRECAAPRAIMQRGECRHGECGQYSISISNGEVGLTIRFDTEVEFKQFMTRGELSEHPADTARTLTCLVRRALDRS